MKQYNNMRPNSKSREQRKLIARETLEIQKQGFYTAPSGKRVDISAMQKHSEEESCFISASEGAKMIKLPAVAYTAETTAYEVINASTVRAIIYAGEPVAVLNFASAKNPGGGFLNGSMAQEEALAISSGLYSTLLKHPEYYSANKSCASMMYTDNAIYSKDVVFFRNIDFVLLEEPVTAPVLTLPAVNMRQVIDKGENVDHAKTVMKNRMRLALAIFAHMHNEIIILGAYGCGVFGNDPYDVASWWKELLIEEGYEDYFRRVIFAVMDRAGGDNITAFERVFGNKLNNLCEKITEYHRTCKTGIEPDNGVFWLIDNILISKQGDGYTLDDWDNYKEHYKYYKNNENPPRGKIDVTADKTNGKKYTVKLYATADILTRPDLVEEILHEMRIRDDNRDDCNVEILELIE